MPVPAATLGDTHIVDVSCEVCTVCLGLVDTNFQVTGTDNVRS